MERGAQHGYGGWQPVVRRHGGRGVWSRRKEVTIHSVFVDNIPESMGSSGLHKLFSNYGVVTDTFIPHKRRKLTRSRFGFVRYNCDVSAAMAVQKANGLWCGDCALRVKMAEFGKDGRATPRMDHAPLIRKKVEGQHPFTAGLRGIKSFAEVVSGRGAESSASKTIKVYEAGNGWLYESAVVRLKPLASIDDFREEMNRRGCGDIIVRLGGGRDIVLSFQSAVAMKEQLVSMKEWLYDWCESVLAWRQGMVFAQERSVWLSCFGVPLNLWNNNTFTSIGKVWGVVIGLDDDTTRLLSFQCGKVRIATSCMEAINQTIQLECKGVIYPVRVCEEQIIVSHVVQEQCTCNSKEQKTGDSYSPQGVEKLQCADKGSRQDVDAADVGDAVDNGSAAVGMGTEAPHDGDVNMEVEDRLRDVSVVAETDMLMAVSETKGACEGESAQVGTSSKFINEGGRRSFDGEICTPGFIRSLSGSARNRLGIQIEVDLDKAHFNFDGSNQGVAGLARPSSSGSSSSKAPPGQVVGFLNQMGQRGGQDLSSGQARKAILQKKGQASRRKHPKKKKQKGQSATNRKLWASSLNLRKGAVFRSAVAAISLSMASGASRGRRMLSEAEASLQIGKVLGLDYEGKEQEVISKLNALEAKDKEKVRQREGDAI
ncbi:hypothetical protein CsSME_00016876 [Camellia sinensis var. sinensis]